MKKTIAFTLVFVLMMSLCSAAWAAPLRASARDADAQIDQLYQYFKACQQPEKDGTWYYAVTDLDHNGQLELLAAAVSQNSRIPDVKAWELEKGGSALQPIKLNIDKDQHFANILTDSTETRYDKGKDIWYYIVSDFFPVSDTDAYLDKSAFFLKSGLLDYGVLASEQISAAGSSFTDTRGNALSVEDFNAVGDRYFKGSQKGSTNFEWFTAPDAAQRSAFADSYAVFTGDKAPAQTFEPSASYPASYLAVTKNPTTESVLPGDTALFVAGANAYSSLEWVCVAPNGAEYSAASFAALFPTASVNSSSTTLSIGNVPEEMSGWSFYCIFRDSSRVVWTNSARLYVQTEFVIEDLDAVFYAWFADGSWVCPSCGNICYGDFCPYCGFDIWVVWYEEYDDDAYVEMLSQYSIDADTVTYVDDDTSTQQEDSGLISQDDSEENGRPSLLDDIEDDLLSLFDDKDGDQDEQRDDQDLQDDTDEDPDLQDDADEDPDLQDDMDEDPDLQDDMDEDPDLQDDMDEDLDDKDNDPDEYDPDDEYYWLHHKRK